MIFAAMLLASLAACGGNGDKLAGRVEDAADNRADAIEAQADALKKRAEQVRDTGRSRSDAIGAADVNAQAMSQERRDAIAANEATAVR